MESSTLVASLNLLLMVVVSAYVSMVGVAGLARRRRSGVYVSVWSKLYLAMELTVIATIIASCLGVVFIILGLQFLDPEGWLAKAIFNAESMARGVLYVADCVRIAAIAWSLSIGAAGLVFGKNIADSWKWKGRSRGR